MDFNDAHSICLDLIDETEPALALEIFMDMITETKINLSDSDLDLIRHLASVYGGDLDRLPDYHLDRLNRCKG